jgi:hypothetical protein
VAGRERREMSDMPSARKLCRVAIAGLLAGLFVTGCGHAGSPVPPPVTLSNCGSDAQPQPTIVEVVCNTDDITARNLAWTNWGKPTATGRGVAVVDLCAYEDCHTGSFAAVPIRLVATRISACGANKRAYLTLRYVFTDGSPWPGVPADVSTSHYMAGSDRPLPPPDQRVALGCGS